MFFACTAPVRRAPAPTPTPSQPTLVTPPDNLPSVSYHFAPRAHYSILRSDSVITFIGSRKQVQAIARTAYVTLSIESEQGGAFRAVLDSLRAESGTLFSAAARDSATGTSWTSMITSMGRLGALAASQKTLLGDQIAYLLSLLIPVLPPDGLHDSSTWTDSTSVPVHVDSFEATETSQRVYRYTGRQHEFSVETVSLTLQEVFHRSGKAVQSGRAMSLTGHGVRSSHYSLTQNGHVFSAEGRDSLGMSIMVAPESGAIPAFQIGRFRIQLLSGSDR